MAESSVTRAGSEAADFAELLLVYLLLLFPLGALGWLFVTLSPQQFGLNEFDAGLLATGIVVAALEITDRRPSPVRAAGFTVVDALVGFLVLFVLVFLGAGDFVAGFLMRTLALLVAYVVVFTEGGPWLADRFQEALQRTTKAPPQE